MTGTLSQGRGREKGRCHVQQATADRYLLSTAFPLPPAAEKAYVEKAAVEKVDVEKAAAEKIDMERAADEAIAEKIDVEKADVERAAAAGTQDKVEMATAANSQDKDEKPAAKDATPAVGTRGPVGTCQRGEGRCSGQSVVSHWSVSSQ